MLSLLDSVQMLYVSRIVSIKSSALDVFMVLIWLVLVVSGLLIPRKPVNVLG